MQHWFCSAEAHNHKGIGEQGKTTVHPEDLEDVVSGEDRMSVSHQLPDECDDWLLLHDVAGVEWGGGCLATRQDRGS